jgi:hypothetical protein
MNPLLVGSLILLAVVLLFTGAISSLTIPRYRMNISRRVQDQPTGETGQLPPHLGDAQLDESPEFREQEITAHYLVSYPKRVYFSQLFWLRVEISSLDIPLPVDPKRSITSKGFLRFTHKWFPEMLEDSVSMPRPRLRVELKSYEDEFRIINNVQVKPLPATEKVVYDFAVKSLKSEDSLLAVEIAYVGSKWKPQEVVEIKITENHGDESTIKTMTPASFVDDINILAREELAIETKSFLNMNATSLNILSKALAAILTAIYIGLVVGFGLTDDVLATILVGLSSLTSALGIPLAADLWKDAQVKREKTIIG